MVITSESEAVTILDGCKRDPLTREAAGRYLEHHPTARLIPRLVLALRDDDEGVRQAAAEALISLRISAWPDLLQTLMDPKRTGDPRLRRGAYHVLRQNPGMAELTAPLMRELRGLKSVKISAMIEADRLYKRMATNNVFAARVAAIKREESLGSLAPKEAQMMVIPVGAVVRCADGLAGYSRLVIVNPIRKQVTHLVVEAKDYPCNARLVPLDRIQESAPRLIRLQCTLHELAAQKPFIDAQFRHPETPYLAYVPDYYVIWPYFSTPELAVMSGEQNCVPPGELAIFRDAHVTATDGQVGRVDEFLVNPQTGDITHLVMRKGHLWSQKDVTIPIAQIDHIAKDNVYLKLDKHGIEALSAVPVSRG